MRTPNLKTKVSKALQYLVDSNDAETILASISSLAHRMEQNEKSLTIEFKNGLLLEAESNRLKIQSRWPLSFQTIMQAYGMTTIREGNAYHLILGDNNSLDLTLLEDSNAAILDQVENLNELVFPIATMSGWWVYHPTEKNQQGDSLLCYIDHEDMNISKKFSLSVGVLFLTELHRLLSLDGGSFIKPIDVHPKKASAREALQPKALDTKLIGKKFPIGVNTMLNIHDGIRLIKFENIPIEIAFQGESIFYEAVQFQSLGNSKFFLATDHAYYLFKIEDNKIEILSKIEHDNHRAPVLVDDKIFFYKKGYPEGFAVMKLNDTFKSTTFQQKPPGPILNFTSSAYADNILVFASAKLIAFDQGVESPQELYSLACGFARPKIHIIQFPFAIVFETDFASSTTESLIVVDLRAGKVLCSFQKGEWIRAFHNTIDKLLVIATYKNKTFMTQYELTFPTIQLLFRKEVALGEDDDINYIQQIDNGVVIGTKEGKIAKLDL